MVSLSMPFVRLIHGRHEKVLADYDAVDHVITDPPYGARTHGGQKHGRSTKIGAAALSEVGLSYPFFTHQLVHRFVDTWAPRTKKWFCAFTSHDLVASYESALEAHGRYVFAPIACVQPHSNVRLAGDGPSNWTTWLIVSRPIGMKPLWGALPGRYESAPERRRDGLRISGSKPLSMMLDIVRDYSRAGDRIADPYAGAGVTLIAAALLSRQAIGAECDRETFELAKKRLRKDLAFPRAESQALS
jgi:site-specific DNA-methyltransferase (adenine-specific)